MKTTRHKKELTVSRINVRCDLYLENRIATNIFVINIMG